LTTNEGIAKYGKFPLTSYMASSDDIGFGSDEDDLETSARTWKNLSKQLTTEGYREGLDKGKEDSLQAAFDDGYKSGYSSSQRLSELRGFLSALLLQKTNSDPELCIKINAVISKLNDTLMQS